MLYSGPISIGSNKQPFNVLFDTEFALLWVTSINCNDYTFAEECSRRNKYDSTKSTTYIHIGWYIAIYGGNATGYVEEDQVNWGGINIQNFKFADIDTF